jgi:hypothetical protein
LIIRKVQFFYSGMLHRRFGDAKQISLHHPAAPKTPIFPGGSTILAVATHSRGERNFWMQRREAKIGPRDCRCHRRPKEQNETGEKSYRNGPFLLGLQICGLVGLDGGVRSHIRTGLEQELPDNWLFTGYFPEFGPVIEKMRGLVAPFQCLRGKIPTIENRTF